ncbi:MAG: sugar transferase [Phycisphaerales bacterium]|nr:sugar transferase [Phycisphaerales bacterium]
MACARTGMYEWALARPALDSAVTLPEETVHAGLRPRGYMFVKRALDIGLSSLLMLLMWPIALAAAMAIKLTSRGPIFLRQLRAGQGGRPFAMYQFRSIYAGAEAGQEPLRAMNELSDGPCLKIHRDPRLTPVGAFLRRTGIEDWPQLFNVLRGDMSLAGPRPWPLSEGSTRTDAERRRLSVVPGLTGLWQISGRCEIPNQEWMQLDLDYIEHRSMLLDLEIMVKTIPAVLSYRGAF